MSATNSNDILIGDLQKSAKSRVRVQLRSFKGRIYMDARQFWIPAEGDTPLPSGKGFALDPSKIGALIVLLQKAETEARARGLLDG